MSSKTALASLLAIHFQYIYFCWLQNKNESNYIWGKNNSVQCPESWYAEHVLAKPAPVSGLESLLWISHLDIISQPFCLELSFCPCSDQGKANEGGTSCLSSH